jgi:hypothetical protein
MPDAPGTGSHRTAQIPGLGNQANVVTHWLTAHGMSGIDSTGKVGAGGEFAKQASAWQTQTANTATYCGGNSPGFLPLVGQAEQWQTPATDSFRSRGGDRKDEMGLDQQSQFWTTPQAHDVTERGSGQVPTSAAGNACLARDARTWPSPTSHDGRRPGADLKSTQGANLSRDAATWPTPASRDSKGENSLQYMNRTDGRTDGRSNNHADQLPNFVMMNFSPQDQATQDGPESSEQNPGSRRRLNPAFAAWLMGLKWWWTNPALTNSVQSEMVQFRSALRSRLQHLLGTQE